MSITAKRFNVQRKYTSLVSAEDWFAFFDDGEDARFVPVVVWAAYEDSDGEANIVGLITDEDFPTLAETGDVPNFEGYYHRAEIKARLDRLDRLPALPADLRDVN